MGSTGNGEDIGDAVTVDLGAALGAQENCSTQCFTVYIPNKDKDGKEIGTQRKWIPEALSLLTELDRGATAMPPTEGVWGSEQGELVWEHPVETNQGEVAFEFESRFYLIRDYDPPARPHEDAK